MRLLLLTLGFCLAFTNVVHAQGVMTGPFKAAYVPKGFDANDRVQITVEGSFNDSCYRVDDPQVKVDQAAKEIRIQAQAYKVNGFCFVLPGVFVQTINLGRLSAGTYKILSWDGTKTYDALPVAASRVSSQDDFPYAAITQAYVSKVNNVNAVVLETNLDTSCQDMKTIKVTVQDNVIVVQPILELQTGRCGGSSSAVQKTVELPVGTKGHFLLHVRSMAGTALNTMVDVQ